MLTKRLLITVAAFAAVSAAVAWFRDTDPFAFGGPMAAAAAMMVLAIPIAVIADGVRWWRARGQR